MRRVDSKMYTEENVCSLYLFDCYSFTCLEILLTIEDKESANLKGKGSTEKAILVLSEAIIKGREMYNETRDKIMETMTKVSDNIVKLLQVTAVITI